jgi:high-affinity iron transporter
LGWTNSATYGTVISYNVYWLAIMAGFGCMIFNEKYGHWPWARSKRSAGDLETDLPETSAEMLEKGNAKPSPAAERIQEVTAD